MSQNNEDADINTDDIKSKTKKGLISLFSRSMLIYLLRGVSILLLSRFLAPEDYGVFGVLNSWIWGINLFLPDLSMFTALIQQKNQPNLSQMRNLYGVSLYRGIIIVLLVFVFGHFIIEYHKFDSEKNLMFMALSLFIFFDCLKTPLRMMIERNLDFQKVVIVEVCETIVMYIVQIIAAWRGMGAWSFVLAILSRSVFGLLLYFYFNRKIYLPVISVIEIKKLFHFELMVQLKTISIGIKGLIVPIILGRILSTNDLGIVIWTIGIASIPVILVHNYDRVLFPALSRLQSNLEEFRNVASKGIEMNIAVMGLLFGMIAISSTPAINFFFPAKWSDAKMILPISCFAIFLSQVRYLGGSLLNAKGKPRTLLKIEGLAILLEFSLAIPAVYFYQVKGYFFAIVFLELFVCTVMFIENSDCLKKSARTRFVSVLISCLFTYFMINQFLINKLNSNFLELVIANLIFLISYMSTLILIDQNFLQEMQYILRNTKRKYLLRNVK